MGVSVHDFDGCQPDAISVGATSAASNSLARARRSRDAPTDWKSVGGDGKDGAGPADEGLIAALRRAEERIAQLELELHRTRAEAEASKVDFELLREVSDMGGTGASPFSSMGLAPGAGGRAVVRKRLSFNGESAFRAKLGTILQGIGGSSGVPSRDGNRRKSPPPVVLAHVIREDRQSSFGFSISQPAKGGRVRVSEVQPGSSAENAGLRVGDVLLSLDGIALNAATPEEVSTMFTRAGTVLAVEVISGVGGTSAPSITPDPTPVVAATNTATTAPAAARSSEGPMHMPIRASVLGTTVQAPDLWTFFLGWRRWRRLTRHRLIASYQADGNESPVGGGHGNKNSRGDDDEEYGTIHNDDDDHDGLVNASTSHPLTVDNTAVGASTSAQSESASSAGDSAVRAARVRFGSEKDENPAAEGHAGRPDSVARLSMEFVRNPSPPPSPPLVVTPPPPPLTARELEFQRTERALYTLSETLTASRAHMQRIEQEDDCPTAMDRFHADTEIAAIYQESADDDADKAWEEFKSMFEEAGIQIANTVPSAAAANSSHTSPKSGNSSVNRRSGRGTSAPVDVFRAEAAEAAMPPYERFKHNTPYAPRVKETRHEGHEEVDEFHAMIGYADSYIADSYSPPPADDNNEDSDEQAKAAPPLIAVREESTTPTAREASEKSVVSAPSAVAADASTDDAHAPAEASVTPTPATAAASVAAKPSPPPPAEVENTVSKSTAATETAGAARASSSVKPSAEETPVQTPVAAVVNKAPRLVTARDAVLTRPRVSLSGGAKGLFAKKLAEVRRPSGDAPTSSDSVDI